MCKNGRVTLWVYKLQYLWLYPPLSCDPAIRGRQVGSIRYQIAHYKPTRFKTYPQASRTEINVVIMTLISASDLRPPAVWGLDVYIKGQYGLIVVVTKWSNSISCFRNSCLRDKSHSQSAAAWNSPPDNWRIIELFGHFREMCCKAATQSWYRSGLSGLTQSPILGLCSVNTFLVKALGALSTTLSHNG